MAVSPKNAADIRRLFLPPIPIREPREHNKTNYNKQPKKEKKKRKIINNK